MRYQAKPVPVQAIRLADISITYEKWGGLQHADIGDWLLSKEGEVYTCAAAVFADTYQPLPERPGWFVKVAYVEAEEATEGGAVETLEGLSTYRAGDFLVVNPGGDRYCVEREKFLRLYDEAHPAQ